MTFFFFELNSIFARFRVTVRALPRLSVALHTALFHTLLQCIFLHNTYEGRGGRNNSGEEFHELGFSLRAL